MRIYTDTLCAFASLGLFLCSQDASASETKTYTYDSRGQAVKVDIAGGPADAIRSEFEYDPAGNRTLAKVSSTATPACSLQANNFTTGDEFTAYPTVSVVGSCGVNITLGYTVTYVSGTGTWGQSGFYYPNPIPAGQTTGGIRVYAGTCSVNEGDLLVLHVNWTADNATVTPAYSTVSFFNSC